MDWKDKICHCKLAHFNHNVKEMLDHIQALMQKIEDLNGHHEDLVFDTFKAQKMTKNSDFLSFVNIKKDCWDTGNDITFDTLATDAMMKYNNLVKEKTWDTNITKDSKIVALTTQVEKLQKQVKSSSFNLNCGGSKNNSGKSDGKMQIANWRLSKTLGDHVYKDGKDWWWCHK